MKRFVAFLLVVCCLFVSCSAFAAKPNIAPQFHSGLAWFVDTATGLYGYINTQGQVVVEPKYEQAFDFNSSGYAKVFTASQHLMHPNIIDTQGKIVVKNPDKGSAHYDTPSTTTSYNGTAPTVVEVWKASFKNKKCTGIEFQGYNFLTAKGVLNKTVYTSVTDFSPEGFAVVGTGKVKGKAQRTTGAGYSVSANKFTTKYLFINDKGKQLGKKTWDGAMTFSNGYAPVATKNAKGSLLWGFIDTAGKVVAEPKWSSVLWFVDGFAKVAVKDLKGNDVWGVVDESFQYVVEPVWEELGTWHADSLMLARKNGKYGYLNDKGETALDFQWDKAGSFISGCAAVAVGEEYGYIDETGKYVVEPTYASAYAFNAGYATVNDGAATGVIDPTGKRVVPCAYDTVTQMLRKPLFRVKEFSKPVIVDAAGNLITVVTAEAAYAEGTPCKFIRSEHVGFFCDEQMNSISMNTVKDVPDGDFTIHNGTGLYGIRDAEGNWVVAPQWEEIKCSETSDGVIYCVLKNGLYGYLNDKGETLAEPQFTKAGIYADDAAIAWKGGTWYILNTKGNVVF